MFSIITAIISSLPVGVEQSVQSVTWDQFFAILSMDKSFVLNNFPLVLYHLILPIYPAPTSNRDPLS